MGQGCCAQHNFDTHELDNLARNRYIKTHPNCEIEQELTSLSSELLDHAIEKSKLRKRKLILITSATSAIGKSLCIEFASKSNNYIVCGISNNGNTAHIKQMTDDLDKISSTIKSLNYGNDDDDDDFDDIDDDILFQQNDREILDIQYVDVCNEKKVALWIMDILELYGVPDIVINNSTVIPSSKKNKSSSISYDEFVNISDKNVTAYFHLLKYIMPSLIKRKHGIIINLTGTSHSIPTIFKTAYNSSKFAMEGYVESLLRNYTNTQNQQQPINRNYNISFITMTVGSLDMKSQRILSKLDEYAPGDDDDADNDLHSKLLKHDSIKNGGIDKNENDEKVKDDGVSFERWASKTVPMIVSLSRNSNKNKINNNNKFNKYTTIDRIVELDALLQ